MQENIIERSVNAHLFFQTHIGISQNNFLYFILRIQFFYSKILVFTSH